MEAHPRPAPTLRILIADRDPAERRRLVEALTTRADRSITVLQAEGGSEALALAAAGVDVIVADVATLGGAERFAALSGRAAGATLYGMGPGGDVASAVSSVRAGAADYLDRPVDAAALLRRIERQFPAKTTAVDERMGGLVCRSPAMRTLMDQVQRIARSEAPVLLTGAPATGKGRVARLLHDLSRRSAGAFVTLDCRGLEDGAFAEILTTRGGVLDRSIGGTLHLREVGALPHAAQGLVLRLVDGGELPGAGGRIASHCRFIVSASLGRAEPGRSGGIRPDLYFRLAVLPLRMPALCERAEDVAPTAAELLRRAAARAGRGMPRLLSGAEAVLASHGWTGNIAQLSDVCDLLVERFANQPVGPDQIAPLLEQSARRILPWPRPAPRTSLPTARRPGRAQGAAASGRVG